ncbi:MAG: hypothetical protein M0R80_12740 [Proteobacteria bacterium]|jgi:hypothetical protein|nr:hypothetical protein [Pseudomonadota bacterium]
MRFGIFPLLAFAALPACISHEGDRRSEAASDGGEPDAGDDAGVDECDGVDFPVAGHPPRALVVLDRSASMGYGLPVSPWDACAEALVAITAQLDYQIEFGLLMYPELDVVCGAPAPEPIVPVGPATSLAIEAAMTESGPVGYGTPTAAALARGFEYVVALEGEDDRFVILATDGAPNCSQSSMYDCSTCTWTDTTCVDPRSCLDDVGTYSVVIEYHDNWGVDTYVIGLGGVWSEWDEVLGDVAAYGGTGDYYPAQTEDGAAEMTAALQEIAAANTECVFDVDWESLGEGVSQDPGLVNLLVEGEIAPFSEGCANPGGWHWADEDTIELCPGLCEDYKWGVVSWIHASFGCETVVE